jgi:hypothetical protein
MSPLRWFLAVLVLFLAPLAAHALDAPTGTYSGTLVHERTITLLGSDPLRATTFKQKTKVAGFGAVPQAGPRAVIHLIVPPGRHTDLGRDREFIVDFNPDPPTVQIFNALDTVTLSFPNITVEGNVVTIATTITSSDGTFQVDDVNTLRLKRTKP